VTVTDQEGAKDTARHQLHVLSRIGAYLPQADLGPDRLVAVSETVEMTLSLPFEEPVNEMELDGVTTRWRLVAQPLGSDTNITDHGVTREGFSARFTPSNSGKYTVAVILARDGREYRFERNVVATESRQGGLPRLPGAETTSVSEATFDFDLPTGLNTDEVSVDPEIGARVLRTEIDIGFRPEATVAQANAVLDEVNGGVVSMIGNTNALLVRIPDPGDIQRLNEQIARVDTLPGVATVNKSVLLEAPQSEADLDTGTALGDAPSPDELPGGIFASNTSDIQRTDHHLAVRGHGAWNLREAISDNLDNRPWIVIGDFFGDDQPDVDYDAITDGDDFANFGPGNDTDDCEVNESCDHGYHVLGIILGDYGPSPGGSGRDDVTGIFPGFLRVNAVDLAENNTDARTWRRLVRSIDDVVTANGNDSRVVVNTSIGFTDPPRNRMNRLATRYSVAIQFNDLQDNVLHATAAGNTVTNSAGSTVRWPATRTSPYTFATLGDISTNLRGVSVDLPELNNILVVENRTVTGGTLTSPPSPGCLNASSLFSGNISGIGTAVWSFGRTVTNTLGDTLGTDSRGAQNLSGTSMSTPQVAGVAAYTWAVDDSREGPELLNYLQGVSRSNYTSSCGTTPQPSIDALDAVRSAEDVAPRRALHDVATGPGIGGSDGVFDADDLRYTLGQFAGGANQDYGRYDFNGDGWTDGQKGSSRTEPLDLNADGERESSVSLNMAGYSRNFDETDVTDLDVLCFDAFDAPYNGSTSQRNRLLGEPCGIVGVEILSPSAGDKFTEGDNIEVEARLEINARHDGTASLRSSGNQVDSESGWGWSQTDRFVSLNTRRVCPASSELTVRFDDSDTGLRAEDKVQVAINAANLEAHIAGPHPRYVRVHPGPRIDPIPVEGQGMKPTCNDPFSERLDQQNLTWLNDQYSPLSSSVANTGSPPTSIDLLEEYLADGIGGFQKRLLRLRFVRNGRTVRDRVWIKPCSSDLFGSDVSGYPQCPNSAVVGDIAEGLRGAFDVSNLEELIKRLSRDPEYRGVLDKLGRGPCDPQFCDPVPPAFPKGSTEIIEEMSANGYDPVAVGILERLFRELKRSSGPVDGRERLQSVMENVRNASETEDLTANGRDLVHGAYSVTLGVLDYFAATNEGGANGWAAFMSTEEQERFHAEGDRVRPAHLALAGYLTTVNDAGIQSEFGTRDLAINGAEYGAAIGAVESYQEFQAQ
jgi:hypothetical protein